MATTMRGRGCRKDPAHRRTQRSSRDLFGSSPSFPASASLACFEAPIEDQGPTSSCGGHGTSQGLAVAFGAAGRPLPFVVSPDGVYRDTRCVARARDAQSSPLPPLSDSGIAPSDLFVTLSTWGVRAMGPLAADGRNSDVEPSSVNREPRLDEVSREALTIVTGGVRVDETASDMEAQLCAAIAGGIPVGCGAFVDTAFEAWGEGWTVDRPPVSTVNLNDPGGGGHWFLLDEYLVMPDGSIVFSGPNSWGGWGAPPLVGYPGAPAYGHLRVTGAWLRAAAYDLYLFTVQDAAATEPLQRAA